MIHQKNYHMICEKGFEFKYSGNLSNKYYKAIKLLNVYR